STRNLLRLKSRGSSPSFFRTSSEFFRRCASSSFFNRSLTNFSTSLRLESLRFTECLIGRFVSALTHFRIESTERNRSLASCGAIWCSGLAGGWGCGGGCGGPWATAAAASSRATNRARARRPIIRLQCNGYCGNILILDQGGAVELDSQALCPTG